MNGKMGVSDLAMSLFATKGFRQSRQKLYNDGADAIQTYLQGISQGKKELSDFNKAFASVDENIKAQALSLRNDEGALASYGDNLRIAASGLEETGLKAIFAAAKTTLFNAAVKAAKLAVDSFISIGLGIIVSKIGTAIWNQIDNFIHASEKITEAAEEAEANVTKLKETFKSTHDTVLGASETGGIAQEFAELSQGVDAAGNNLSLTSDEYERYLELSNQLADLFPTLTRHYDENGNAIVNLRGSVDSIVDSLNDLVEAQRKLADEKIMEESPKVFADVTQQLRDLNEQYTLAKSQVSLFNDATSGKSPNSALTAKDIGLNVQNNGIGVGKAASIPIKFKPDVDKEQINKFRLAFYNAVVKEFGYGSGIDVSEMANDNSFNLRLTSVDGKVEEVEEAYRNAVTTLQQMAQDEGLNLSELIDTSFVNDLSSVQNEISQQTARLTQFISTTLNSDVTYAGFSDVGKQIVSQIASGMDPTAFSSDAEWLQAIKDDVVGIYSELMNSDYGSIFEQLLTMSTDKNIDSSQFVDTVDKLVKQMMEGLGVSTIEALQESYPQIAALLDALYGEQADILKRFQNRVKQLKGSAGVDLTKAITTASDQELFLSVANAYDSKAKAYEAFLQAKDNLAVGSDLSSIKDSVKALTEYQSTVQSALSGDQISVEQYETLIAYSEEYRDALELEGEQITLNREAVEEINKAQVTKIKNDVKEAKSNAQIAYHRNRDQLIQLEQEYNNLKRAGADTTDVLARISELQTDQSDIRNAISEYEILEGTLSDVAQAYEKYNQTKQSASPEEHYETNIAAVKGIQEGLNSGKVGTSEFMADVELMVPVEKYQNAVDKVAAIGEYYDETLSKYFKVSEDDESDYTPGLTNFLNDSEKAGLMTKTTDESGIETWTVNAGLKLEDFAKKLGLTKAAVESLFKLANSYSFGGDAFNFNDELMDQTTEGKLYKLESEYDDLMARKKELEADPDISWDDSELVEIRQRLKEIDEEKAQLGEETFVNVKAKFEVQDQIETTKSKIKSLKDELNQALAESHGVETPGVKNLRDQLQSAEDELAQLEKKLGELGGGSTTAEIEVAITNISEQKEALQAELKTATVEYEANPTPESFQKVKDLNAQIAQLDQLEAAWTLRVNEDPSSQTATENTSKDLEQINAQIDTLNGKTATTSFFTTIKNSASNANTAVQGLATTINNLHDRSVTIETVHSNVFTTTYKASKLNGTVGERYSGERSVLHGTAHAKGTARSGGTSDLPDDWKLDNDETALTGELGPEMVVRGNKWFLVGKSGTEFANLKRGDVVFNHQQTKDLLTKGSISGRGRAKLNGSLPSDQLALVTGSFSFRKYKTKNNNGKSSSGSSSSSSSSSGSSGSSSSSGSSGASSSSNSIGSDTDTADYLDWIEVKLDRIQQKIEQTSITAESAYKSFSDRNKALAIQYDQVATKMETIRDGIARYEAEANAVGLDANHAALVRAGKIDIEKITDDDLKKKIQLYQQWWEKALDLKDENAQLEETLRDLAAQNFDNLITEYEGVLNTIDHKMNLLNTYIDRAELQGKFTSGKYYEALISQENDNLKTLTTKRKELNDELNRLVDNKEVEIYSEKWYELKGEIEGTDEAIAEANNSLLEFSNTMRQLKWDKFDYIEERVARIADEADFLSELIGDDNLFDADTGAYTDRANAQMGLYAQSYTAYMDQTLQYKKAIEEVNAALAKDPANQILVERQEALVDAQHDAITAARSERQAMIDLAKDGYQAQIDALNKLIEKKQEMRDAERDLYEYQRDIAEQTKNISSLRKQLAVYEAQGTEESQKKVQELRNSLADAEQDLQDSQYDRFKSDQDKLFDDLTTEYQDFIDKRLADTDALFGDLMDGVNSNVSSVRDTITSTAEKNGAVLSDAIHNIWSSDNPVSVFDGKFENYSATVISTLDVIRQLFEKSSTQSDATATGTNSSINKNNASIGTGMPKTPTSNSGSSSSSGNKPNNSSSASGIYGTGRVTARDGLRLREGPNTSSRILGLYGQGTNVSVLERVNNEWYKVKTSDGKTGYMSASWLSVTKASNSATGYSGTGTVTAPDGLRLRASNSTTSAILGAYGRGTNVSISDKKGDWYKVTTPDGKTGWMSGDWLNVVKSGSYATGGVIGDVIRKSGEDGMILAKSGEAVLTADQIHLLRDVVSTASAISPLIDTMQSLSALTATSGGVDMTIENITLPNVTKPEEFADGLRQALKNDVATQKAVRAITVDLLAGKNSLSVRKY